MDAPETAWVAGLAEEYGRMVLTTARRILGDPAGAEDAQQTVFLELLRMKPAQRQAVREWAALLRVMATRTALDQLRRRSRHPAESGIPEQVTAPREDGPEFRLARKQRADRLRSMLRRLSPKDARIFALRYFEDLTYDQIAEVLQISESSVGVRLHRARKKLEVLALAPEPKSKGILNAWPRLFRKKEESHVEG
ncbi:MAG: sigma-70 family RNA polymerase sigma factor [Acidobacteriota bacterium]|nr:sigma-70 family RNA polymerase sigma factor [Acidobacteriota bacterium]